MTDHLPPPAACSPELRESEEKYRLLFESSFDGIFLESLDQRILDCNEPAARMLGYTKAEILRLRVPDLVPEEDVPLLAGLQDAIRATGGFRVEARNKRKDGTVFPVEVSGRILELGGRELLLTFVRDLTQLRRATEELRERERFLANIFASIQDGISILDQDFTILRVNPVMEKWYAHHLPLLGKKCYQAYYGRNAPCEVCPSRRAIRTESAAMDLVPRAGASGQVAGWLELYSFPLRESETGRISGVIEYVRDVTERKQAEDALAAEKERLAVTLRSIGDGVITTDVDGRVVLLNQVAERMTGWSQEEAAGRPLPEVFHIVSEESRRPSENPVDKVMRSGAVVGLANHTLLIRRDGVERVIADSGSPIRDRESRIVGVVLVFRDITEKRQADAQLQKSEKLESLGILAGGIAHDFNNILTGILGNISLVRAGILPGNSAARLEEAEKACFRARDLTQQLLTFSRGGMPVKTTASIREIIAESARFALRGSRASLSLDLAEDLWPAEVDSGQISQMIHNLVLNADQAMPNGGEVRVRADNYDLPEPGATAPAPLRLCKYIRILVEDDGPGIPLDIRNKIFDPFFTTKQMGSGIGLTTCYSIVSKHDGFIVAESPPGQGARFCVYLPAAPGRPVVPQTEGQDVGRGAGRVLVMDDEESIREVLVLMLSDLGYRAEAVSCGEEAVERYERAAMEGRRFDAVILDLTIPGKMGGQAAMARLMAIDPRVVALVSSGYSTDPIMSRYRDYGFAGVILKPYDLPTLSKTLREILAR